MISLTHELQVCFKISKVQTFGENLFKTSLNLSVLFQKDGQNDMVQSVIFDRYDVWWRIYIPQLSAVRFCMYVKYRLLNVLFNSSVSSLVFYLVNQSTTEGGLMEFPTRVTNLPFSPCCSMSLSFCYFGLLLHICKYRIALLCCALWVNNKF